MTDNFGEVIIRFGIQPKKEVIDTAIDPKPDIDREKAYHQVGWLARMTQQPSIIELLSKPVSRYAVREALRKQLNLWHEETQTQANVPPRQVWLLSHGLDRRLAAEMDLHSRVGWPAAFRFAPGLHLCVVMLCELPRTRETLPLRVLAREGALLDAVEDWRALPDGDVMKERLYRVLLKRRFLAYCSPEEDPEAAMVFKEEFDKFQAELVEQGRRDGIEQGIKRGQRQTLRRQLERKLGPLSGEVLAKLEAADSTKLELLADRVLEATSLDEMFADKGSTRVGTARRKASVRRSSPHGK